MQQNAMNRLFRIYRTVSGDSHFLARICTFLADRPGSLAELASVFKNFGINITLFHYDRSEHPNRVLLEVKSDTDSALHRAYEVLSQMDLFNASMSAETSELGVLDTRSILKIEIGLEHTPGTLGSFAGLLRKHEANVIHMEYNEDVAEQSARISLFTKNPDEVDKLLKDITASGYYYSVIFKGAGNREIEDIIGLNLTERFFFKLKSLLHTDDVHKLRKLIDSSQKISSTLSKFSREAGRHYEDGDTVTTVLAFASASLMNTGEHFSYRRLPTLFFDDTAFHSFRMPAGGNIYILQGSDEYVMIDSSYGLYYDDVKSMMVDNGLDPSLVKRIYLTHADADHAGLSGYFARDFGSRVYLHEMARGIIEKENRAWGSGSSLMELNHFFTVLVNEFTGMNIPENWIPYGKTERGDESPFKVIDKFTFAGQTYSVIESLGGHVPGQVFIYSYDSGLFFTGDYLLLTESISSEEKDILNYPKYMMTSTNVNSTLFRSEMHLLKEFIRTFDSEMKKSGRQAIVVPGHGDYYPFDTL